MKTYKGKYIPKNKEKYVGDYNKIIYRSSWELKYMRHCDLSPKILKWNSEDIVIPYFFPYDGKMHRYYMDFWIRVKNSDGTVTEHIIEVKPNKEKKPPRKSKNKKRYLQEQVTYQKNQAKWEAAHKWALRRNMTFVVMDEYDLGIKQRPKRKLNG